MTLLRTVYSGLSMSIEPIYYQLVASQYYKYIGINKIIQSTQCYFLKDLTYIDNQQGYPTSPSAFSTLAANSKPPLKSKPAVNYKTSVKTKPTSKPRQTTQFGLHGPWTPWHPHPGGTGYQAQSQALTFLGGFPSPLPNLYLNGYWHIPAEALLALGPAAGHLGEVWDLI